MKIAVINEISAYDKNNAIIEALKIFEDNGHSVINAGMKKSDSEPELTYIDTGFLAALLINTGRADFIVGGCGTGQGFLNSVMQYPGVFCGLIESPLDAWLFTQINGGNCISLALNKGFGWAGDINLKFIFERLINAESGGGYPPHRVESQKQSRSALSGISKATHLSFSEIVSKIDKSIIGKVLSFPGVRDILDIETLKNKDLKLALSIF